MKPQVLIVDDALTIRKFHRKVLADAGWQVEEAANGIEALEKVALQPADQAFGLFVVDLNMPKMDGYAFVRALRELPDVPQAPVLMVSTEAQDQDATGAHEAGANAYLIKPPKPAALLLTAALLVGDGPAALRAAQLATAGAH